MAALSSSSAVGGKIAIICPPTAPALDYKPLNICEFLIGNELAAFEGDYEDITAIMFVATGGDASLLTPLFDKCPNVRWVHSLFAGVDSIAPFITHRLQHRPEVAMSNGRGAFSASLAEYVMASALHFNKKFSTCAKNRAERKWDKFVMPVLEGKTIGFLGFGSIGQRTATLASAFGMKVLALRRDPGQSPPSGFEDVEMYSPDQKLELFAAADFVVSVLPGTPETTDFCGAAEFGAMKPSGVFISVGRGTVVDEEALADCLEEGRIAGAALDVFKTEPLPESSRLWSCENLIMTAHNADYTDDYFSLGWRIWRQNFEALQAGSPVCTPVDRLARY